MHRREGKTLDSENKYIDVNVLIPKFFTNVLILDYNDIISKIGVPWKIHSETHQIRDDTAFHSNPALAQHLWDLQSIYVAVRLNAHGET